MSEPTQEEVIGTVSSLFDVRETTVTLEKMEFEISDLDFKQKFVLLAQKMEKMGLACFINKSQGRLLIQVNRLPPQRRGFKLIPKSWTPRILFAIVVSFV